VECVGLDRFKEDGSGECAFEKWEAKGCGAIENKIGQRLWYEWMSNTAKYYPFHSWLLATDVRRLRLLYSNLGHLFSTCNFGAFL
jgi:hypothetical protein